MLRGVAPFFLLLAILLPVRGQNDGREMADAPIRMTPEFALAIPLVLHGTDVSVTFPVLINRTTVIKPGMVLRNMYVPPRPDESVDLNAAHMGNLAESFSRDTASSADQAAMTSNDAHEIERQRRVVWEVPINFRLAMAQLPTDSLHVIFSPTGDDRHLQDERFDFFDGLLLGSPTGKVTVLAVEINSEADHAGFKAGDDIVAVGGAAMPDDLTAFPQLWVAARARAKDYNQSTFSFLVRSSGAAGTHTVNFPMPPTIKSQLMDGF